VFENKNSSFTRRRFLKAATAFATLVWSKLPLKAMGFNPDAADSLSAQFRQPPAWAKPWVQYWWFADVKKEDITRDLEAMQRQGIQGALVWPDDLDFDAKNKRELFELLKHTLAEADRLDMDMNIKPMQGATAMAGDWIDREHALKSPVWSWMEVQGPQQHFRIDADPKANQGFYRDVAVLAYKVEAAHETAANHIKKARGKVTGSEAVKNPEFAVDEDPTTSALVSAIRLSCFPETLLGLVLDLYPSRSSKWIACEFPEAHTVSSVVVCVNDHVDMPTELELQRSDDGKVYSPICKWRAKMDDPTPIRFQRMQSRFYRLVITENNTSDLRPFLQIRQFDLLDDAERASWPRIDHWLGRTGQGFGVPWYDPDVLEQQATHVKREEADVAIKDIVDLTSLLGTDRKLEWDVPTGRWRVLRFGYTLTMSPSMGQSDQDQSYFCDVLSREAAQVGFDGLPLEILKAAEPSIGRSLKLLHEDSWEVEENMFWTPNFEAGFKGRRNYNPHLYLPALAGAVVESGEITDRFLWDYRRTVADMIADNYVATLTQLCRENGVRWHSEIPAAYMPGLLDSLRLHARADVISGEFWARSDENDPKSVFMEYTSRRFGDAVTTAASAAHTEGKKIVDAESFTHYSQCYEKDFFSFKDIGDRAFCRGVNRMSLLGYPSQDEKVPGRSLSWFCDDWNRHNTWWPQSHAWFSYLARCQYLLQQGLYQADLCYLNGEGVPSAVPGREYMQPAVPEGYSYDGCSAEALRKRVTVKNGALMFPDGMSYRILVLPERETMTPETLSRISDLVEQGAIVAGPKPRRSPSLANYPECDREVDRIGSRLWGDCDGRRVFDHKLGKGRVVWGKQLSEILADMDIEPDFEYSSRQAEANVMYIHRKVDEADVYFLSNQRNRFEELEARFRVTRKAPELWYPDTGRIVRQAVYREHGQRTILSLRLEPRASVFVVFRDPAPSQRIESVTLNGRAILLDSESEVRDRPTVELSRMEDGRVELAAWKAGNYEIKATSGGTVSVQVPFIPDPMSLSGPWEVRFPAGWGTPATVIFPELVSWTEHDDPDIKYFSGTANYVKQLPLAKELLSAGRSFFLDLGHVCNIAEVKLNGNNLGVLWKPSFRVEITGAAKPGQNLLEVAVTNLWPNRLIRDQALPKEERRTWTETEHYPKNWPLYEAGLLGPVQIQFVERKTMDTLASRATA
jgi:alpha-L-rhamnosidase